MNFDPSKPIPKEIVLHKISRILELQYTADQDLRKIALARRTDEDSTRIVRQGGLSRGFEQHAASLRNGLRMQAQTGPARATQPERFCANPEDEVYHLPFEYLRVYSPSAEVQGHGLGQAILQVGKRDVEIDTIETVGQYAVKPSFSDGHNTGIYSWGYLYQLATQYATRWQAYLTALEQAGATRDK